MQHLDKKALIQKVREQLQLGAFNLYRLVNDYSA